MGPNPSKFSGNLAQISASTRTSDVSKTCWDIPRNPPQNLDRLIIEKDSFPPGPGYQGPGVVPSSLQGRLAKTHFYDASNIVNVAQKVPSLS